MSSHQKENRGKVSIAMTTYNGVRYVREQLDSLLAQTEPPAEIVICDDGSTDGTVELLQNYAQQDARIRLFCNDVSLGVNRNFLQAMARCSGDWIMLCDQDDYWYPEKIERCLGAAMDLPQQLPLLVTSRAIPVDVEGRPLARLQERVDYQAGYWTLLGHNSQGCTLLMNRLLVQQVLELPVPNEEELVDPQTGKPIVYFDWAIGLLAVMLGVKLDLGQVLMDYRIHPKNVTAHPSYYRGGSLRARIERWLKQTYTGYEAYVLYQPKRKLILEWVYAYCREKVAPEYANVVNQVLQIHTSDSWLSKLKILRQLPKDYPFRLKLLVSLKWLSQSR